MRATGGESDPGRGRAGDESLSVTWYGHATVLVELDGASVLTDPVLRSRVGPLVRIVGAAVSARRRVDAVVVSHLHADHADLASLRMVEAGQVFAPPGSGSWLSRRGVRNVHELAQGERARIGAVSLTATPAAHEPARWRFGPRAQPMGVIVEGSQSCYFAGDTDLYPGMSALAGRIDLALLPVAGWGRKVGPGHLDAVRAAEAVERIAPRVAIPIHWGTLAPVWQRGAGRDRESPATHFSRLVAARGGAVDVRVLAPGGSTCVAPRAGSARRRP